MKTLRWVASFATLAIVTTMFATTASAQATRTWVSGVGDDANPCSRTAPCKTFAGAISKTAAGGEINCLDPGGFGAVTITKAMAIICQAGTAGVLVSGTNGVIVNAGTADVYLQGLDFEGVGTGLSAVLVLAAGKVSVVDCIVRNFTTAGINVGPTTAGVSVDVLRTIIADNDAGGTATGILIKPTGSASARVTIDDTHVSSSGADGIMSNANATTGSVKTLITRSTSENNGGSGFAAFSSSGAATVLLDSDSAVNNTDGIAVTGTTATVSFTRSSIIANSVGVLQSSSGTATSFQTNSITGNGSQGSFGTTGQQ